MVRIQNNTEFGPEYKPEPYNYQPDNYKSGPHKDPLKRTEYKPKEYQQSDNKYEYKPFQPTHVGMYGDKPGERVVRKPRSPVKKAIRRPRRTFESYGYPKGPDIRLGDTGPEYEVKEYQPTQYKPYTPGKVQPRTARDPINSGGNMFIDRPVWMYDGHVDYKLDEHNNAGMGHWRNEFVDDTVATYGTEDNDKKYKVDRKSKQKPEMKKEEPKPKESEPEKRVEPKPIVAAAVLPVHRANSPPRKKTFTTSSTQHVGPAMKTGTTQTQANKMITSQTQFEPQKTQAVSSQTSPTQTPIPAVIAAPLVKSEAPKKVKTTSQGVQCSDSPRKVVKGTQSDGPVVREMKTQTSPMPATPYIAPVPFRERTPQYAEQVRHETPVYRAPERHTPAPTIIPIVAATSYSRRSPTPRYRTPSTRYRTPSPKYRTPSPRKRTPSPPKYVYVATPLPLKEPTSARPISYSRWTPSPEVAKTIPYVASAAPPRDTPKPEIARGPSPKKSVSFPYQPTKSRLPPEVIHCLEAYDNMHGP